MNKFLVVIASVVLFASCETGSDLEKKKKELADAKTSLKEISTQIATLEKEIALMDTSAKVAEKGKLIQADSLVKQEFKHYIEVQGNVDADENVTALPQQPGVVSAIYVKEGDRVTKGQLLAITETTAAMEAAIATIQTQYDLAKTAFEKQERLWNQKIGSEIQYLSAKTQKDALEKQIAAQRTQLEMTKIKAPITGTVDNVNLKIGDMAIGSQLMPGIRIINNTKLSVKAKLADSDFGKIKQGDKVEIEFPDINKSTVTTVNYVSKTIDPRSRTFEVETKINNTSNEYAANMIAKLKINDAIYKNVLLVPSNIIQKSEEGTYVLTAESEGGKVVAKKNMVKTGANYNGRTIIEEGLSEGQRIITFGYTEVVDGQAITLK
ncbi:MAG: efflux RND transporter periplasmic adaptor subunit [Bacteroidetes bacterium]|nr:efflux RND transporter periplasmic adaptor subunit [Bacteroidota bacterium]MBK8659270.1 efflux RND transporter periplasmic adaptor subunit [Bacteroidota bacterium]